MQKIVSGQFDESVDGEVVPLHGRHVGFFQAFFCKFFRSRVFVFGWSKQT
jgi:hypothetical protein